jgi:hypothetical protein
MSDSPLRDAEYVAPILAALDDVLDWTGQPWNMAEAEAKRDYYHLTRMILTGLHKAGFIIVAVALIDGQVTRENGA